GNFVESIPLSVLPAISSSVASSLLSAILINLRQAVLWLGDLQTEPIQPESCHGTRTEMCLRGNERLEFISRSLLVIFVIIVPGGIFDRTPSLVQYRRDKLLLRVLPANLNSPGSFVSSNKKVLVLNGSHT